MATSDDNDRHNPTVRYYGANADEFAQGTFHVDFSSIRSRFVEGLSRGCRILDAGCGSGRDTKAFIELGYEVTAIDASGPMVGVAKRLTGHDVLLIRFQDITFEDEFCGIWACASLIHIPLSEIDEVFRRFIRALKRGGIWYMSFKRGGGERFSGGRFFLDQTIESLAGLISRHPKLEVVELWETPDFHPNRGGEAWVNAIVRKSSRVHQDSLLA